MELISSGKYNGATSTVPMYVDPGNNAGDYGGGHHGHHGGHHVRKSSSLTALEASVSR